MEIDAVGAKLDRRPSRNYKRGSAAELDNLCHGHRNRGRTRRCLPSQIPLRLPCDRWDEDMKQLTDRLKEQFE
jgi:hypothetical protein